MGPSLAPRVRVHWDATAKRAFPFLVCVLVALVAYLQARGMGALVAAEVQVPPKPPPMVPPPPVAAVLPNAAPILEHNPFDSDDDLPAVVPLPPEPTAAPGPTATKCDVGYVTLITGSEDPSWSFASLEPKSGDGRLVRIGDAFEGHEVARIGWSRVWLRKSDGAECVMKLGDKPEVKKAKRSPKRKTRRKRRSRRATQISAEMKNKIHRVSATEYQIERSVVDEILQKQAELMRHTRVRPMKNGDDIIGMRLSRIRRGTLLYELGLRNGDVLQSINGFDLTNPQKALEAYGRLRTAQSLSVQIQRKGKPTTIEYALQ